MSCKTPAEWVEVTTAVTSILNNRRKVDVMIYFALTESAVPEDNPGLEVLG